jgi:ABC-type molybdate transport system substrate-binding protein
MAFADTVQLFAAGSLKTALTDVAKAFEAKIGNKVEAKYGASGVLRKEITDGAKADIFASANMEHPQALNDDGTSGPVALFARNKLCALVKPGLDVTTACCRSAASPRNRSTWRSARGSSTRQPHRRRRVDRGRIDHRRIDG